MCNNTVNNEYVCQKSIKCTKKPKKVVKKIFDATSDVNMRDVVMRPFPPGCPLEDVKI